MLTKSYKKNLQLSISGFDRKIWEIINRITDKDTNRILSIPIEYLK